MRFEWDSAKARSNIVKHDVAFELAAEVWDDPFHLILPDRVVQGEERWHAIGMVRSVTILVVVHCHPDGWNEDAVRIISARRATSQERRRYEQQEAP